MSAVRVGDVDQAISARFPQEWAEEWDRVGLLAGDPDRGATGVVFALDPTRAAVSQAVALGANVLVTHHPAFLTTPNWLVPGRGSAGVVFAAMDAGVALINAHTNLDRAPSAGRLLPDALGLEPIKAIERATMPMSMITVFVPPSHVDSVGLAMSGAGAGRLGEYHGCRFVSAEGEGAFTPSGEAKPHSGAKGQASGAVEVRLEMVAPQGRARGVIAAARGAHPYEEPLITSTDVEIARASARMGMLNRAPEGSTLESLVRVAAREFGITPRVWGEPGTPLTRVATATGSASSLVGDVLASGAQALVAGEVRYHDAVDALEMGLAIVELGHDVSEWPLVSLLVEAVGTIEALDPASMHVLDAKPGWWTP